MNMSDMFMFLFIFALFFNTITCRRFRFRFRRNLFSQSILHSTDKSVQHACGYITHYKQSTPWLAQHQYSHKLQCVLCCISFLFLRWPHSYTLELTVFAHTFIEMNVHLMCFDTLTVCQFNLVFWALFWKASVKMQNIHKLTYSLTNK